MTVGGEIKLVRVHFECLPCQSGVVLLDNRLGVQGRYSHQAQRLICLAGASWSYDLSSRNLQEFCGLKISDSTIRTVSQQHGALAGKWLRTEPAAVQDFREARGEIEFTTDGTSVNTRAGWREMKLGIFSKRERGEAVEVDEWASRSLPDPQSRIAFAAVEKSEQFGKRWNAWCPRLGIRDTSTVTLLADGARWIWEEQRKHLTQADGVLDIFHVLEHLAVTAKELYPEPRTARAWLEKTRESLLREGLDGVWELLDQEQSRNECAESFIQSLRNYLLPHAHHLNYARRLQEGRSIGSGQVEGACKNVIGRRLKANSARWRVRRINRMAGLCCLLYTEQWECYWQSA